MSTRSYIINTENGKYEGIYCHHDGYPDGVGRTLLKNYNDSEKMKELVSLGGISSLYETAGETEKERYAKPGDRDWEVEKSRTFKDEDSLKYYLIGTDAEYAYVFNGNGFTEYDINWQIKDARNELNEKHGQMSYEEMKEKHPAELKKLVDSLEGKPLEVPEFTYVERQFVKNSFQNMLMNDNFTVSYPGDKAVLHELGKSAEKGTAVSEVTTTYTRDDFDDSFITSMPQMTRWCSAKGPEPFDLEEAEPMLKKLAEKHIESLEKFDEKQTMIQAMDNREIAEKLLPEQIAKAVIADSNGFKTTEEVLKARWDINDEPKEILSAAPEKKNQLKKGREQDFDME